jgi:TolB protein
MRPFPCAPSFILAAVSAFSVSRFGLAEPASVPPAEVVATPDESILGTVEVNGSSDSMPPLPKLAVVPMFPSGAPDSIVNLVVRRDMDLSGQFEVLPESASPSGPFTRTTPIDLAAWRERGAEYLLRVYAQSAGTDPSRTELVGEAYLTSKAAPSAVRNQPTAAVSGDASPTPAPPEDVKPLFRTEVSTLTRNVRASSHELVDRLLGALTGQPGGFASRMTYAETVGRWRRIFVIDSDGFDLRPIGPMDATALSPTFGPSGQVYYALSTDYSPFQIVFGEKATPVPFAIPGSVMGLVFNSDRSRLAVVSMLDGKSQLWMSQRGVLSPMDLPPFANGPVFGPLGKVAYVAGTPVQRVYIDGKPISPAGFMASAPVFCDTPQGLLVVYTVGVGSGADIIATDTNGGGLRRFTRHEGANTYAACSPDGRLVSFFSTGKRGQGAGLFIAPIARPWLAKKISSDVGESLRWARP